MTSAVSTARWYDPARKVQDLAFPAAAARLQSVPPRHETAASHGAVWTLDLERDDLLPGRIAKGKLRLDVRDDIDVRGLVVALVATERWQHTETYTDTNGNTSTRTVTSTDQLLREPVRVMEATQLRRGETREFSVEVPVPPLGPATLDATVASLTWELQAKLDVPSGFDSSITVPVRVLQPTALLRAGVVRVEQFALYPSADSATDGATASVALEPMPLCVGGPFSGKLMVTNEAAMKLQEIRVELRVHVKATVSSGLDETITAWTSSLDGSGQLAAGNHEYVFNATVPPRDLPTIELPHGRADAQFHVILARPMARDPHLVRDVAICSTTEI
jgi:hypothetical protein